MATVRTSARADVVRTLPTYHEAAQLIDVHPSGITRAVAKLGIVPELWGGTEKHLRTVDVLRIAAQARRASVEEVAGALLARAAKDSELQRSVKAEIDRYFAEIDRPEPTHLDLAGLRARRQEILANADEHGARNVRVFGSIVRGQAAQSSDVDLLVEMEPGRSLFDLVGLGQDLEGLLGAHVDVLSDGGVSKHLRERIHAEAVPL